MDKDAIRKLIVESKEWDSDIKALRKKIESRAELLKDEKHKGSLEMLLELLDCALDDTQGYRIIRATDTHHGLSQEEVAVLEHSRLGPPPKLKTVEYGKSCPSDE